MPKFSDCKAVDKSSVEVDDEPGDYFVSVIDADRFAFALGPYPTHAEALANVERGRKIVAEKYPVKAHWYSYGTSRMDAGSGQVGVFGA